MENDIMNNIYEYECRMWDAVLNGRSGDFSALVPDSAVMVCGGMRCSGAEYAGFIGELCGISSYDISGFEVVAETQDMVQVHYIVKTASDDPACQDLAGVFHVTSTWIKRGKNWQLAFNMDSRIFE